MWVLLNTEFVPEQAARVSAFDRGFLYGDGAFDTLTAYDGRILRSRQHLERLEQSLRALRIEPPRGVAQMEADLYAVLERNHARDGILRVSVSRGLGPRGASVRGAGPPTYFVACYPPRVAAADHAVRLEAVSVRKTPPQSLPAQAKSANYINSILALAEAVDRGADEALLLDIRGFVAECAYSNVFFVTREGLATPSLDTGIFPGITRAIVLELARDHGLAVREELLDASLLQDAAEVFITNTVSGVLPVRAIGDRAFVGPGPVTVQLVQWYWALVEREAGRPWSDRSKT